MNGSGSNVGLASSRGLSLALMPEHQLRIQFTNTENSFENKMRREEMTESSPLVAFTQVPKGFLRDHYSLQGNRVMEGIVQFV